MGTPHVHCISNLPTAHEPSDERSENCDRPGARDRAGSVTTEGATSHRATAARHAGRPMKNLCVGSRN
jgi:hypothetical protein